MSSGRVRRTCQGRKSAPSVKAGGQVSRRRSVKRPLSAPSFKAGGQVLRRRRRNYREEEKETVKKKKIIFVKGGNSRVEAGPSSRPSQDSRTSQVRGRVKFKLHSSNTLTQHTGCE